MSLTVSGERCIQKVCFVHGQNIVCMYKILNIKDFLLFRFLKSDEVYSKFTVWKKYI